MLGRAVPATGRSAAGCSWNFSVDGTLIEAWASMKSFKPKPPADGDSGGGGRNAPAEGLTLIAVEYDTT
jgi:hypothetical protein